MRAEDFLTASVSGTKVKAEDFLTSPKTPTTLSAEEFLSTPSTTKLNAEEFLIGTSPTQVEEQPTNFTEPVEIPQESFLDKFKTVGAGVSDLLPQTLASRASYAVLPAVATQRDLGRRGEETNYFNSIKEALLRGKTPSGEESARAALLPEQYKDVEADTAKSRAVISPYTGDFLSKIIAPNPVHLAYSIRNLLLDPSLPFTAGKGLNVLKSATLSGTEIKAGNVVKSLIDQKASEAALSSTLQQDVLNPLSKELPNAVDEARAAIAIHKAETGYANTLWNYNFKRSSKAIEDMGPTGQELVNLLKDYKYADNTYRGGLIAEIWKTTQSVKPTKDEFIQAWLVAEGKAHLADQRLKPLVDAFRRNSSTLGTDAANAGLKIKTPEGNVPFTPRDDYMPHRFSKEAIEQIRSKEGQAKFMDYVKSTGQAKDDAYASELYRQFLLRKSSRKVGAQHSRLTDAEGYTTSPAALYDHIDELGTRIGQARFFGPNNEKIETIVQKLESEGHDIGLVRKTVDHFLGTELRNEAQNQLLNGIRNTMTITKLGPATAGLNWFQRYNVPVRSSWSAYRNSVKLIKEAPLTAWENTIKTGEVRPQDASLGKQLEAVMAGQFGHTSGLTGTYLKQIGMITTEVMNRLIATNAGRFYATELLSQLQKNISGKKSGWIKDALKGLGIDADKALAGGLQESDLIRASQQLSKETQFWYNTLDLPINWSSEMGKTATQLKPASYQQWILFKDYALKQAIQHHNFKPLLTTVVLSQLIGETYQDVKGMAYGKYPWERGNILQRMLQNASSSVGLRHYVYG